MFLLGLGSAMSKIVGLFWRACLFSLAVNFRLNDCDRHETASSELSTDSVSPPSSSLVDEGLRISSGWHLKKSLSQNILEQERAALMWEFIFIHKSVTVIGYIFPPLILWLLIGHWRKPSLPALHAPPGKLELFLSFENMMSSGSRSSLCHCSARSAVHVRCFCTICNGKAVNYRTQISHLTWSVFFEMEIARDAEPIGGKL